LINNRVNRLWPASQVGKLSVESEAVTQSYAPSQSVWFASSQLLNETSVAVQVH